MKTFKNVSGVPCIPPIGKLEPNGIFYQIKIKISVHENFMKTLKTSISRLRHLVDEFNKKSYKFPNRWSTSYVPRSKEYSLGFVHWCWTNSRLTRLLSCACKLTGHHQPMFSLISTSKVPSSTPMFPNHSILPVHKQVN